VFLAACFLGAVASGSVLFLSPPGRVANWTNWTIGGLAKHEWIALHVCFSAVFLGVAAFHVFFNWRPLLSYFKDRVSRRVGLRVEWVTAVVVAGAVGWAGLADLPPFKWLLAASENLKQRWEQPASRAPIPHAELLALSELAARANVPLETATDRLNRAGIKGHAPDIVVEELSRANSVSAQRVYEVILGQGGGPGRGAGRGGGGGPGGGGGGGGGHGGGLGWKTLEQFCADEGLAPAEVLDRLKAKDIKVEGKQTLREIAVANGYDRPFELIELMRGARAGRP
jgi:uncharacterized membrane protein YgcG